MRYLFQILVFSFLFNSTALANPTSEKMWVQVTANKELYVEYYAPEENKPTIVLLHGLTYTTLQWTKLIKELTAKGYGVVCYDMEGMGQSLLKYAPIQAIIPHTSQVEDLNSLLRKLKIKKPYHIAGLSYGGGIAFAYAIKYPQNVANLILMSPYTKPVENLNNIIKAQVAAARLANPFNPFTDDQMYEFFFRQFVYSVYPVTEPIVLENPYKLEAVFRLAQGIGTYVPEKHAAELSVPTHLMIAENDQYFPKAEFENFWSLLPAKAKKNLFYVKNSEHKIPEAEPKQAADMIQNIVE